MHHEWLASHPRQCNACGIREPVMGVNHIKVPIAARLHNKARVCLALRKQIARVIRSSGAALQGQRCATAVRLWDGRSNSAHHLHHLGNGGRIVCSESFPCFQHGECFLPCIVIKVCKEFGRQFLWKRFATQRSGAQESLWCCACKCDALQHHPCARRCVGAAGQKWRGNHANTLAEGAVGDAPRTPRAEGMGSRNRSGRGVQCAAVATLQRSTKPCSCERCRRSNCVGIGHSCCPACGNSTIGGAAILCKAAGIPSGRACSDRRCARPVTRHHQINMRRFVPANALG